MTHKKCQAIICFAFILTLICLMGWAAQQAPTVQAQSGLPPRATPVPPGPPGDKDDAKPIGAYIELHPADASAGTWSVVQWQDSAGNWHDVEGWSGTLDQNGGRRWWVAAKDFGKGPFRWVISRGPDGTELGRSQPFNLPARANEITVITLSPLTP